MNIFQRALGHIYFFLGMLWFFITMLMFFIPIWITTLFPEPGKSQWLRIIFRIWMEVFLNLVGCPVLRRGKHHFKKGQNYVVVLNHNSFVDIPVSSPWIPGANKTLAKSDMAKIPVFGTIYKAGSILLERSSLYSRRESFVKMQAALDLGLHLCLYPEGTRNKGEKPLQDFYDGAFIAAINAQKPLIPGLLFNTRRILPNKPKFWARPSVIRLHFLEPVSTEGLTLDDVPVLKQKVHHIMETYYVANQ